MYFKIEDFSRGPSFKSIQQFLKILQKLVKLKNKLLTADLQSVEWIFLKKGTKFEVSINLKK